MSEVNRGWTVFGKSYHRGEWVNGNWRMACNLKTYNGMLDQTEYRHGEPTGALVPTDLTPCNRCFP